MPRLPRLTAKQVIKLLKGASFELDHITGSHYIFYHSITRRRVTVPYHRNDLPTGTLKSILREADIDIKK